jgi:carbamoyltransferase
MNILGITHPVSRNSAACILKDGKLIAFAEEERFNKIKHSPYHPVEKSVNYCLNEAGIKLEDVDFIAIGFDTFTNVIQSNLFGKVSRTIKRIPTYDILSSKDSSRASNISSLFSKGARYAIDYYQGLFRLPFNFRDPRVIFVRHHIAHCASAYYISPFKEACIISVDGGGGQESGMLAVGNGDTIDVLKKIPSAHSLGFLYSTITELLGFQSHDGEGKVMGLSVYGSKNVKTLPFVSFKDGLAIIDHNKMNKYLLNIKKKLKKDPLYKVNRNLAASLQKTIEKAYVYMGKYLYKETGIKNFCLTGGVSLNCLANTKLLTSDFVDDIFVQPASSDAGTALGAALQVYVEKVGKRSGFIMKHAYYGPQFSNNEILRIIKKAEIQHYKKYQNIEKKTARLLADGKIIGWFQGRMEIGPRALGNRSILANPSILKMKDILNKRVKGREPWRPFAPSLLEEYTKEYLLDVTHSEFMILESRSKKEKRKSIQAATHINGTVRPQTVSKKTNPRYWKLINEFRKITNIPVVLNTSFNLAGEPIVCTPEDAISTFFRSGFDYLVLGNYLVAKSSF